MSDPKELEIHLQFLEEAQEYLDTLGSCLLGLPQHFEANTINDALRAAHSIKGGAALMGFQQLSELAHRLEDSLKVLKIQRGKLTIDASLEQQLLAAVDCLSQVMVAQRHQLAKGNSAQPPLDDTWMTQQAQPIFEQLRDRLGDPEEEDAYSLLSPEEGQDIIPLLFEGEVEGCLIRLESVLAEHSPCLREEVQILAQELGGLGEMLQLEPFILLCHSIAEQVTAASEVALPGVAEAALATWRQAQALVLTNNMAAMPTQMPPMVDFSLVGDPVDLTNGLELDDNGEADLTAPLWPFIAGGEASAEEEEAEPALGAAMMGQENGTGKPSSAAAAALNWVAAEAGASTQETTEETDPLSESTVRVPIKQINQLSDLFGELTIERNRLELEVTRLRDLVSTLQNRMRTLDQVNSDLRSAYDRVATQADSPPSRLTSAPETHPETHLNQQFDVLEMDRYRDLHLPFRETIETIIQLQEVGADIELSLDSTDQTTRSLRKTSRQLQKNLTHLRMRPLSDIFKRFPKALRQMSLQYNKPVDLKLQGERTLVDRNVLEALQEPLMHIIRNCFDHGIEDAQTRQQQGKPVTGMIAITAYQQSGRTYITIHDDGGGISVEKIRDRAYRMGLDEALLAAASEDELLALIFEPGFSTATEVTDLSGRGIGMDVVRSRLKEVRGDIKVETQPGEGTVFTLSIPFTLTVTRVLIAESRGMRMGFPVESIEEIFMLPPEAIFATAGKDSFEWNGKIVQLVRLTEWLHFNCPVYLESPEIAPAISTPTVLLVYANQRWVGVQVERSWGEQEVALRRVLGHIPLPQGFNSCTIMGDGQVVPLVNVPELLYWIASCEANGQSLERSVDRPDTATSRKAYLPSGADFSAYHPVPRRPTILLIDDSINVRRLLALTLEKAGYQVAQAKDGQDALDKLSAGLDVEAVICDVEMPRLDGYGFLARLRAETPHQTLPVAMLTSRSSQKHRKLAMDLGASAYFTKPYNEQHLLQTLETMIQLAVAQ